MRASLVAAVLACCVVGALGSRAPLHAGGDKLAAAAAGGRSLLQTSASCATACAVCNPDTQQCNTCIKGYYLTINYKRKTTKCVACTALIEPCPAGTELSCTTASDSQCVTLPPAPPPPDPNVLPTDPNAPPAPPPPPPPLADLGCNQVGCEYCNTDGLCKVCKDGYFDSDPSPSRVVCSGCDPQPGCTKVVCDGPQTVCTCNCYGDTCAATSSTCTVVQNLTPICTACASTYTLVDGACPKCADPEGCVEGATTCDTGSVTANPVCTTCKPGYRWDGVSKCIACAAGTYSPGGKVTTCTTCAAGYYSGAAASTCEICLAGTYAPAGASSCTTCQPGQYTNKDGATTYSLCPTGKYADQAGATSCTDCVAGTYALNEGTATCSPCPAGKFSPTGASDCTSCPAGTYTKNPGTATCSTCLAGTFSTLGSTGCTDCLAGEYSNDGAGKCDPCPVGQYTANPGTAKCSLCPAGTYADVQGTSQCKPTPAMYYSTEGASSYSPCAPGTWSALGGGTTAACTACSNDIANCLSVTCTNDSNEVCTTCWQGYHLSAAAGADPVGATCIACTSTACDETAAVGAMWYDANKCVATGTDPGCSTCKTCTTGNTKTYISTPCQDTANTVCTTCGLTPCAEGYYYVDAFCTFGGTDSGCKQCTSCGSGYYVKAGTCTGSIDAVCVACSTDPGTCEAQGKKWNPSTAVCACVTLPTCGPGTYLPTGGFNCVQCTAACGAGTYEKTACTASTDRVCESCSVDPGTCGSNGYWDSAACKCVTCAAGQYLDGTTCKSCTTQPKTCSAAGTGWNVGACACVACTASEYKNGNVCVSCTAPTSASNTKDSYWFDADAATTPTTQCVLCGAGSSTGQATVTSAVAGASSYYTSTSCPAGGSNYTWKYLSGSCDDGTGGSVSAGSTALGLEYRDSGCFKCTAGGTSNNNKPGGNCGASNVNKCCSLACNGNYCA